MKLYSKLLFKINYLSFLNLSTDDLLQIHNLFTNLIIKDIVEEDTTHLLNEFESYLNDICKPINYESPFLFVSYNNEYLLLPTCLLSFFPKQLVKPATFSNIDLKLIQTVYPESLQVFVNSLHYIYSLQFIYDLFESELNKNLDNFYKKILNYVQSQNIPYDIKENTKILIDTKIETKNYVLMDQLQIHINMFDNYPDDTFHLIRSLPMPLALYPFVFVYKVFEEYGISFPISNITKQYSISDLDDKLTYSLISVQNLTELAFTCKRLLSYVKNPLIDKLYKLITYNILGLLFYGNKTENCSNI